MKNIIFSGLLLILVATVSSQENKAVFLHHSTGGNVFNQGNVLSWIEDFNTDNNTDYTVTERSYPNSPWPWENYPYDYWKLWIGGECNNDSPGIECIESIASTYELVIYKHCYPGAGITANDGNPSVNSKIKTLENYKLQYRALRDMMDDMPEKKFMLWTLAPLHRLSTNTEDAARAYEFVEWVKNDFLTEDDKEHPNIYIFDFYGAVAELNKSPENGQQYCLKYDFERNHNDKDSHPNSTANEYAGPLFARAIVNALASESSLPVSKTKIESNNKMLIYPQPIKDYFTLSLPESNYEKHLEIISIDGKVVIDKHFYNAKSIINTHDLHPGMYFIKIKIGKETHFKRFIKQ